MALASSPVMLLLLPPAKTRVDSLHFTDTSSKKNGIFKMYVGLHACLLALTFTFMFVCDTVDINHAKFQVNPC